MAVIPSSVDKILDALRVEAQGEAVAVASRVAAPRCAAALGADAEMRDPRTQVRERGGIDLVAIRRRRSPCARRARAPPPAS